MEVSSDPYEQKLYHMFKSHDTDASGSLDSFALAKLCKSLELNDKDNILIGSLLTSNDSRVTFKAFKEALLNFLGTQMEAPPVPPHNSSPLASPPPPVTDSEKALQASNEQRLLNGGSLGSPNREVSPKLIMGNKKYGRRSRPQSLVVDESSQSDTENEQNVVPNVQRSSSQNEINGNRRRKTANAGTKLKRCLSLPAQKNHLKLKERSKLKEHQSVVEKPQLQKQNQLNSSVESLGNLDFENLSNILYEVWTSYGNDLGTNFLNRVQLEAVCGRIGLHKIAGKVAEEVFEKLELDANDTVGFSDFFGLIQSDNSNGVDATGQMAANHENGKFLDEDANAIASVEAAEAVLTTIVPDAMRDLKNSLLKNDLHADRETIKSSDVIEMWENSGVPNARELLRNLGFDVGCIIPMPHLLNVLEDEIRSLHADTQTTILLRASLVLRKAELVTVQQTVKHLAAENKTLHSNNRESNQRVALLAQEIDERHTTLEEKAKIEIRSLEHRHIEVVRDLTAQLAIDRENWANLNSRLEARIKCFEQNELKHRNEMQLLKTENSALEIEQVSLQKQVTELLETNIKLNNEIIDLDDRHRNDEHVGGEKDTEEVLELIDKITTLQVENTNLRDKNDELVAELEAANVELNRFKGKKSSKVNLDLSSDNNLSDDPEHSSLAIKRRGDSPSKSKTKTPDESPRTGKLRKCSNDNQSESDGSEDWVALNSELGVTLGSGQTTQTSGFSQDFSSISGDSKDEDYKLLKEKITKLEKLLKETENPKNSSEISTGLKSEKEKLELRCIELDNSLEQMQKAYEECEDYWQLKLTEERNLFEKERQIYEEEQLENNKKFTELMEKVQEYEEQFSKDGRLSPIEEKDVLEQQYVDLECEMEEIKDTAKRILAEKDEEVSVLQDKILDLQKKLVAKVQSELESAASSPINYLWNQSTIQTPARDYQNPKWNSCGEDKIDEQMENLSASETVILSTEIPQTVPNEANTSTPKQEFGPIQKPHSVKSHQSIVKSNKDTEDVTSTGSEKSFGSTRSGQSSSISTSGASPDRLKEELKRLKYLEGQLKGQIIELSQKRDDLVTELQQLQEAKPVLEKAYGRAAHPTLLQRVNHLEQKNRHLQNVLKQQQYYNETIVHQSWQQQRSEITELRNRLETQGIIITEQSQRLTNADILVKDLYVENSHLTANIQRLEQQRSRANLLHQHPGFSGVTGMP